MTFTEALGNTLISLSDGIDDKSDVGKNAVTTGGIESGITSSQNVPTDVTTIVTSVVISVTDGNDDKTVESNDNDNADRIVSGVTSSQIAPVNVVTAIVITVIVLILVGKCFHDTSMHIHK